MDSCAFICLVSPSFCFRFSSHSSFILLLYPCSLAPCFSLWHLSTRARTSGHGAGWQFLGLGAQDLLGWVMARPTVLPRQQQGSGEGKAANCKGSKTQQSSKPHVASFGSWGAWGSEYLLILYSRLWPGTAWTASDMLELLREAPGVPAQQRVEHAMGRRPFPRSLAAKCVGLYWRLAAGFFSSDL